MAEPEVEQKLAAILAADVAGYTRLMADDEPATIATIAEYRSIFRTHIEANGGRVVDMAGDSILAVFTSAAGAVKAAVDVQSEVATRNVELPEARQMRFRVGVNLGDIREAKDGTVYGDGVNIAARLEGLAEPGHICLSDKVHTEVRGKLDLAFDDMGEHRVKNVAEPVRAYRVLEPGTEPDAVRRRPRWLIPAVVAVAVVIAVAGAWVFTEAEAPPPTLTASGTPTDDPVLAIPTGPAIAVLPFNNLSGDPEQDFFADGISEDVLNQISPAMGIQVISRASSFRYRGKDVDALKAGAELGVQFLVLGGVRRTENTIRVTAELVEVETGKKIWSNAYDRTLNTAELFQIQDDISQSIVAAVADEYGVISQLIPTAGIIDLREPNPSNRWT